MRIKTRLKLLEKTNKQIHSKENEVKVGFRVLESGTRTTPFQHTRIGTGYAELLALNNLELLHKQGFIESMRDIGGLDAIAQAEIRGTFKNSAGQWEPRPDIEYELLRRFLEEDHKRLGNDPQWINSLKERMEWLRDQF
jgi:hypothetical protein